MKIAISGLSGVGSSSTAKLVSQQLNLPMTNMTFRALALERGVSLTEMHRLASQSSAIDFELDRRLISFVESHEDCIVSTDIACWLDAPTVLAALGLSKGPVFDLKIWLEAPLSARAKRIQSREGGDITKVSIENGARDLENRLRYQQLYGIDIFDHSQIDWIIDTSTSSLQAVVAMIVAKVKEMQGQ